MPSFKFLFVLCFILGFCSLSKSSSHSLKDLKKSVKTKVKYYIPKKILESNWNEFKSQYNKTYDTEAEESHRLDVFTETLSLILSHNEDNRTSFRLQVNSFADMTHDEFVSKKTGLRFRNHTTNRNSTNRSLLGTPILTASNPSSVSSPDSASLLTATASDSNRLPTKIDWRTKGIVSTPRDQGSCGSCWAFAVAGAIEGFYAKSVGKLTVLSPQQLVDCVRGGYYISLGCAGGAVEDAFEYVMDNGITTESTYPYGGSTGSCKVSWFMNKLKIKDYVPVRSIKTTMTPPVANNLITKRGDRQAIELETKLMTALTRGPVTAAIDAMSPFFAYYESGILTDLWCSNDQPNHAVLVVGYDEDSWILKNSWGTSWGEKGFVRLSRDTPCGLTLSMHQPTL